MDNQLHAKIRKIKNGPFITYLIICITAVIFLGLEISGGSENSFNLVRWGAMSGVKIVMEHQYFRFITPIFLHIGWMHFVINMVTLYYIGSQVEGVYGHGRYFILYLLSGIAGNLVSFAFGSPTTISAGASTSLFGLFGAFVILGRHFRNNPQISFMVQRYVTFIAINLFFNLFSSSVDILGHVGGLLGGFLVATFLSVPHHSDKFNIHERIVTFIFFCFMIVVCLVIGFNKYSLLM